MSKRKTDDRPNDAPGPKPGTPGAKLSASKQTLAMLKNQFPTQEITNDTQVRRLLEIITPEQMKRARASLSTSTTDPDESPEIKKGAQRSPELPSDDPV